VKREREICQLRKSANEIRGVLTRMLMMLGAAFALIALGPGAARAAAMRFKVDADRSTVSVTVAEPAAWIRGDATGTFRIIDGAVSFDRVNIPRTARARILIDSGSYNSENASRDRYVTEKSLEADKYPTIGFESSSVVGVVMTSATEGTAIVTGYLTLHGESHAMTISVHATLGADGVFTGDGEVKFKYEDFGVQVPTVMFHTLLAGDEATVRFHIVAVSDAAPAPGVSPAGAAAPPH
jgi:polyisoprenoid-binding protein YceI